MKRPIVAVLLFIITGIVLGQYEWRIVLFCGCLLAAITLCLCVRYRYLPLLLLLLFTAAGVVRVQQSLYVNIPLATDVLTIRGVVLDTGKTASSGIKLVVDTERVSLEEDAKYRITIYTPATADDAEPGDYIEMTGRLLPLSTPRNPGEYNEWLTQRARKVDGKMFPYSVEILEKRTTPVTFLMRLKNKLAYVFDNVLPEREAAIMKSIILGDKAGLPDDTRELFKYTGIFHLLCISGLHISILMLGLNKLLLRFMNERAAGITALLIMAAYCVLTGAAVSTVRAVTMCGVAVFARVFYREYDLLASTSFACIALLLYEPLYLYDVGFQLSFGAVFGISVLTEPVGHALALARLPVNAKIRNTLAANIAATTATLPVLCYYFYYIPTYCLLVNLIILPTASLLVTLGLLVGLTGLAWLPLAVFLSGAIYYLLRFYDFVCRFFVNLPLSVLYTGCPGLWATLAAIGVMLAFAYVFNGIKEDRRKRAVLLSVTVLVLTVCLIIRAYPPGLTVTILEAGKGYYAVITHRGRNFVTGSGNETPEVLTNYLTRLIIHRVDGNFNKVQLPGLPEPYPPGGTVEYGGLCLTEEDGNLYITYGNAVIYLSGETLMFNMAERVDAVVLPLSLHIEQLDANDKVHSTAENGAFTLRTDGKTIQMHKNGGLP